MNPGKTDSSLIISHNVSKLLLFFLMRSMDKNPDNFTFKKNCSGIILSQEEAMFWKRRMCGNHKYTCQGILSDIFIYVSEGVKYLLLGEL
jgi:hypothetical protein